MHLRHVVLLLVLSSTIWSDRSDAKPATQNGVLRVDTRLVEINVVARDKNGLVADLNQDDFTVFDNGKAQRISVFAISNAQPSQAAAAPVQSGVVSNLLNADGELPSGVTVILLDLLNTDSTGATNYQGEAIKQVGKYLQSIRTEDRVALFVLDHGLHLLQDFTSDPNRLIRVSARIATQDLGGVELRTVEDLAAMLRDPGGDIDGAFANAISISSTQDRAATTMDAWVSIARHLRGLPGRKSLVWVSAGFPFVPEVAASRVKETPDNFLSQINRAAKALNEANVSIYPVDARGLQAPDFTKNDRTGKGRSLENMPPPEVMLRIADATGGRVSYHTNDLEDGIRAAVADGTVSYTLGFYAVPDPVGRMHDLKVKVDRSNVSVYHRSGYYSVDNPALTASERRKVASELLGSELNSSEVGLVVGAEQEKERPDFYNVTVLIDIANIHLVQQDDRRTGMLSLIMRREFSQSETFDSRTIPISLSEDEFQKAQNQGLLVQQSIQASSSDRLRIVIQDQATGLAGALWLPLMVK